MTAPLIDGPRQHAALHRPIHKLADGRYDKRRCGPPRSHGQRIQGFWADAFNAGQSPGGGPPMRVDPLLGSPTQVLDAEMEAELLHHML